MEKLTDSFRRAQCRNCRGSRTLPIRQSGIDRFGVEQPIPDEPIALALS